MMTDNTTIYDLGAVDPAPAEAFPKPQRRGASATSAPPRRPLDAVADSLSLFVPGSGQLLRAAWSDGLFVLSAAGFLVALAWAVLETLDRLPETLSLLGLPSHGAVYALGAIYVGLAWVHSGNILYSTSRGQGPAHPAIAGAASALIPGWGQVFNGQPAKAAAFVGALWAVGLVWLLTSPWVTAVLAAQGVGLRPDLHSLASPAIRWTLPAVLWALSVYDAVATARR